jgi:V-type H+-transporting ATPase subunit E
LEANVTIRVREVDQSTVEGLLQGVVNQYKDRTGKDVNVKVDTESFLAPDVTGGIELQAQRGRIKIANTLEARLELIAQQLVPEIRGALFGRNPNRKFAE